MGRALENLRRRGSNDLRGWPKEFPMAFLLNHGWDLLFESEESSINNFFTCFYVILNLRGFDFLFDRGSVEGQLFHSSQ